MDQDPFGVSSVQFEAEIYKDLFDKRIINIESTINSEGKVVGQYFTFSPFDVEALRKAEIEQEKENKKKPVMRKLKPSKLKYPFNFAKLRPYGS